MSQATLHYPKDFSDWLPPMLVKELRQGLRANLFVLMLVLLQTAMIGFFGMRLLDAPDDISASAEYDRVMWAAVAIVLLGLQPLRGSHAVSEERDHNTMDLMQLTRLSSRRMLWGKWLALVCQTILLVITILPYQVLYYFLGGVDVVQNFIWLGHMIWASVVLTAVSVAASGCSVVPKVVTLLLAGSPTFMCAWRFIEELDASDVSGAPPMSVYAVLLFFTLVGIPFIISVGTARISHPCENSSAMIRLLGLIAVVGALVGSIWTAKETLVGWFVLSMAFVFWAGMEAMTEQATPRPDHYTPWVRGGVAGRIAGRLFYQGWSGGVLYVVLTTCLLEIIAYVGSLRAPAVFVPYSHLGIIHLGMSTMLPAALFCVLPRLPHKLWLSVLIQVIGVVWYVNLRSSMWENIRWKSMWMGLNPAAMFWWSGNLDIHDPAGFDFLEANRITAGVEAVLLAWLLWRMRGEFAAIRSGESLALRMVQDSRAKQDAGAASAIPLATS